MNYLLIFILIQIIILIWIQRCGNTTNEPSLNDISQYKVHKKKEQDIEDQYNIKSYDVINTNVIVHNKFKKELTDLKKYKHLKDQDALLKEQQLRNLKNKKIKRNAQLLHIKEFKEKIELLKASIVSLKLSLKIELKNILEDYHRQVINKNDIKTIINQLKIQLQENEKLYMNEDISGTTISEDAKQSELELRHSYNKLINIKSNLINKKINLYQNIIS